MYNIYELNDKTLDDLKIIAIELGIDDEGRTKQQLIYDIIDHQVEHPESMKKINKDDNAPKKRGRKPKNAKAEPIEKPAEPSVSKLRPKPFPSKYSRVRNNARRRKTNSR